MHSIKYIVLILILLVSCKKDEAKSESNTVYKNGLIVLNEGLFQQNNSTLSWVNLSTNEVTPNVFLNVNDRPLGDTGNDIIQYGGKIYIAVTGSSTIEVIDAATLKSIKQIPFQHNNVAQEPRQITAKNGKVFVCSFDGYVSSVDTVTLHVDNRVKAGKNPDGICTFDQSIFVSNSGGLSFPNVDSTVMEIDISSFEVVDTFIVGDNPGNLIADNYGNIYVVKRGDNSSGNTTVKKINTSSGNVTDLGITASTLALRGDELYLSYYDYNNSSSNVSMYNCASQSISNSSLINDQDITTLYGIFPFQSNQFICLDAMSFTNSGYLRFYSASGQLQKNINVGLNPNNCIYYE